MLNLILVETQININMIKKEESYAVKSLYVDSQQTITIYPSSIDKNICMQQNYMNVSLPVFQLKNICDHLNHLT